MNSVDIVSSIFAFLQISTKDYAHLCRVCKVFYSALHAISNSLFENEIFECGTFIAMKEQYHLVKKLCIVEEKNVGKIANKMQHVQWLQLAQISGIEEFTQEMPGLKEVRLENSTFAFPAHLSQLAPQLTTVSVLGNNSTGDIPKGALENVTTFYIELVEAQLHFIADMTKLVKLVVDECNLFNIEFVSNLKHLKHFSCSYNTISDITPVANLNNLNTLLMRSNVISSLDALANLTNLTELSFTGNDIINIVPLQGLTKLHMLDMDYNHISDLSPLANMRLKRLAVYHLSQHMIPILIQLNPLEDLKLNACEQFVQEMFQPCLQHLTVISGKLSDMNVLQNATGLVTLDIVFHNLSNICTVNCMPALQYLAIASGFQLSSFSLSAPMKYLTELNLRDNVITNISGLQHASNLRTIRLQNNMIQDIACVKYLTKLEALFVSGNKISDISLVSDLVSLKILNASKNPISIIPDLSLHNKLFCLVLAKTDISAKVLYDIACTKALSTLTVSSEYATLYDWKKCMAKVDFT